MNRTIKSSLMRTAAVVLLTLGTASASAQYYMNVVQKNGSKVRYLVSNIDSVFFSVPKFEYVDLGLSVNWATFNVGATSPEEFGDYYPWGEVEIKENNSWSSYKWCNGSMFTLTKYNNSSSDGIVDNKITLEPEDDVAYMVWGGDWRMPTIAEHNEIYNNCTWTWYGKGNSEYYGVAGYKVTSNREGYTDRSIFLPAAGYVLNGSTNSAGSIGYYWYSTLETQSPNFACSLRFSSESVSWRSSGRRDIGSSVRPVCPSREWLSSVNISFAEDNDTLSLGDKKKLNVAVKQNDVVLSNPPVVWSSDNPSVAVVDLYGSVTTLSVGTAHITASIQSLSAQCTVTVTDTESVVESEYVDLGLSVLWASCNVGAEKPEEYGNYYAWGEIKTKEEYNLFTYKWYRNSDYLLTKYNTDNLNGVVDNKTVLEPEDDIASVKLGENWRMPTQKEFVELIENCDWKWTFIHGVKGYKVTSKIDGYTDQSIFLPASGIKVADFTFGEDSVAGYWSSSLNTDNTYCAYDLVFSPREYHSYGPEYTEVADNRDMGYAIRPVYVPAKHEYVDLGLSVKWATCNVGAEKPDECGDYFAWGETETKTDYSWATYKWCNGSYLTMTRYCSDSKYGNDGFTDNKTALDSEDDVAHVKWGGSWRMPTSVELDELRDSCTWTWYDSGNTEFNGVVGYKVTSNVSGYTDRFIFLPAAGTRYDTGRYFVDSAGGLWSSTATMGSPDNSCYIAFDVNNVNIYATPDRYYGFSVRPVCP